MKLFAIQDEWTEIWWSRNRWGSVKSIPDLYKTKEAAERQIKDGKIGQMVEYKLRLGCGARPLKPVIVDMVLEEA